MDGNMRGKYVDGEGQDDIILNLQLLFDFEDFFNWIFRCKVIQISCVVFYIIVIVILFSVVYFIVIFFRLDIGLLFQDINNGIGIMVCNL